MNATCIPKNDLAEFVHGQLESERSSQIAAHVDACESCQDTVVALAANEDTFAVALKNANNGEKPPVPFEGEAALRHGLRRMANSMRNKPQSAHETTSLHVNQIGPYVLEESLGSGGMGTVFRAVHSKLKRDVAVKILPAARWSNASAISRFEREMEAIGQLDHPNIVRASDAGEDQGMHYLVMDYVDGLDLSRLTGRLGPLPIADACEVARQAAEGLQHAHDNGLIHRDVKPSNLMLSRDQGRGKQGKEKAATLRILDLGLALLGDEHLQDQGELTSVGQLMGTLDYMSPEQGIDSHGVDHRTDIYGLGATLFKLLTGRAPYADPRFATLMKKMTALATKPAPSVADFRDDLPAELVTIVDRMLARDPDERFESAEQVATALAPFASDSNLGELLQRAIETAEAQSSSDEAHAAQVRPAILAASTPSRHTRQHNDPGENQPNIPTPSSGDSGSRRNRWIIALAAASAAALAGIAIYLDTNIGNIVVRCDDPDATISVKRNNGKATSINIERGIGRETVRVGQYIVEVKGGAASYEINPPEFDLKRKKEVEISVQATQNKASPRSNATLTQPSNSGPFLLQPGMMIDIDAKGTLPESPISGTFAIEREGTVALGPNYGRANVAGMNIEQAEAAVRKKLKETLTDPLVQISVGARGVTDFTSQQSIDSPPTLGTQDAIFQPSIETEENAPTHNDLSFKGWMYSIRSTRDASELQNAFSSLAVLADTTDMRKQATERICQSLRIHGGVHFASNNHYEGTRHKLIESAVRAVLRMGPDGPIEVLAAELENGNEKSRDFVEMMATLELPMQIQPDRNEVSQFRKGLVANREKFHEGMIPNSPKVDCVLLQNHTHFFADSERVDLPNFEWQNPSQAYMDVIGIVDQSWQHSHMERWNLHAVYLEGTLTNAGKQMFKTLESVVEDFTVTETSLNEHMLFKNDNFMDRHTKAGEVVASAGHQPFHVFGSPYAEIANLAESAALFETMFDHRIAQNDGKEDAVTGKWRKSINQTRKHIAKIEPQLSKDFDLLLEAADPEPAIQTLLKRNASHDADASHAHADSHGEAAH